MKEFYLYELINNLISRFNIRIPDKFETFAVPKNAVPSISH